MDMVDGVDVGMVDGARDDEMIDPISIHISEGVPLTTVLDFLYFVDREGIDYPVEFYISRRAKK